MQERRGGGVLRQEKWLLLILAAQAGFDVVVTVDQGILYQQNLDDLQIALMIIEARSNKMEDLLPHVPACLQALEVIVPGDVVRVASPKYWAK